MIQRSLGNLLEKIWGKGIRPGKSGDTVNRGTVNRGFTVYQFFKVSNNYELKNFLFTELHLVTGQTYA